MSEKGENFNLSPLDFLHLMCRGRNEQGVSLVLQSKKSKMFLLLHWTEDESGPNLISESPSPFLQM